MVYAEHEYVVFKIYEEQEGDKKIMTAISYKDFAKMLLSHNFNGKNDDLVTTSNIPNQQPVRQEDGKYVITYSFFKSSNDLIDSGYYAPDSKETQKVLGVDEYQQNIEDVYKNVIFATSMNDPRYVWFQEVANIKFEENPIGTNDLDGSGSIDQPNEYTTGLIAIGQLEESYEYFSGFFSFFSTTAVTLQYSPEFFPDFPDLRHGDIFYNATDSFWDKTISFKSQQFKVILEETLHSLGVDTKTLFAVDTYLDNQKYSVAAYPNKDDAPGMFNFYTGYSVAPHTLQIMDIAALQEIYGRNYSSFSISTDYTLAVMNPTGDDSAFLYTIWDGGGIDQIDLSASTVSAEIDLRQGKFSSVGNDVFGNPIAKDASASSSDPDPGNVAIAYYTIIEIATGTNQNDIIVGNSWDNFLKGEGGDDIIYGDGIVYDGETGYLGVDESDSNWRAYNVTYADDLSGEDYLYGGTEDDILFGGAGNDYLWGDSDNDFLYGGEGEDFLYGGEGFDNLIAGADNDTLYGGAGNDILYGEDGSDTADYSEDAAAGGTNGVTIILDDNGDGTATDGFGATDTLYSIENLTLTKYADMVILDSATGRTINGGDGYDTVVYRGNTELNDTGTVVTDVNSGETDTLISIEQVDYSAYTGSMIVDLTQRCVYETRVPMYGNTYSSYVGISANTSGTIFLSGGTEYEFSEGSGAFAYSDSFVEAYFDAMDTFWDYYPTATTIQGTNNGDTVLLEATYSSGLSYNPDTITFTAPSVVFMAGWGDDYISISVETEGSITTTPDTTSLTLGYCGGDDTVSNASYLSSIIMWEGLREDEVKITEYADEVIIDAGFYGTLTLNGTNTAPTITWLSETTVEVSGTEGDDDLVARKGETYNSLDGNDFVMGKGDNTINAGDGNDTITTASGINTIYCGNDDDIIIASIDEAQTDVYYGEDGTDRVVLDGSYSGYSITGNVFSQNSGQGSSYTLNDIEEVQFDDGIYDLVTGTFSSSQTDTGIVVDDSFDVPMFSSEYTLDVLYNDDPSITSFLAYNQPEHGTITLNDDEDAFLYMPDDLYEGTDSFTYSVLNSLGNVETATVNINVLLTGPGLGTEGDDVLTGTDGADYLKGLAGNDTLESGGGGGDTLLGGLGWDTYILDSTTTNAIIQDVFVGYGDEVSNSLSILYLNNSNITLDDPSSTFVANGDDLVIYDGETIVVTLKDAASFGWLVLDDGSYVSVSELYSPAWPDDDGNFQAIENGNIYLPTDGDDYIQSQSGSIVLDLLDGDDEVYGSMGADVIFGGAGNDILDGFLGDDALYGGDGDDTFYEYYGNDTVDGGDGEDSLNFGYGGTVDIDLSQNKIYDDGMGYEGSIYNIEYIWIGSSDNCRVIGSDKGFETIKTSSGDDILAGGGGSYDYLYGGGGNDTYIFNLGDGKDTIFDYSGTMDAIEFGVGIDQSDITITDDGTSLVITFDGTNDQLRIFGHVKYGYAIEKLTFSDGSEILLSGTATAITGSDLSDDIAGTSGDDVIDGGAGDDIIEGGQGDDTLYGGEGDDAYIFNIGDGVNTILETSGVDTIALGADITFDNLTFVQNGDDLEIQIASGFIITDFFSGDEGKVVENILFSDGAFFDLTSLLNKLPVANNDAFFGDEDTAITGNVLSNDSDPDGDTLNVVAETIITVNGGTVELLSDGAFTYTPEANFSGTDGFEYILEDGAEGSDTGSVNLTVNAIDDAPVLTNNGAAIDEDNSIKLTQVILSLADVDTDVANRSFTLQSQPTNGTLYLNDVALTVTMSFTEQDIIDQLVIFEPNANFNGSDDFDFIGSDGTTNLGVQTFTINVASVNDVPDAAADEFSGDENTVVTGNLFVDNGNGVDSDLDGDSLTVVEVNDSDTSVGSQITLDSGALLTLNEDGSFSYDPNGGFDDLEDGQETSDSFAYTVSDGNGGVDTQTATITINGSSDTVVLLLGDAPDRLPRTDRNAWTDAWSNDDVTFTHKADVQDDDEAWSDVLISGNGGSLLAGGDILSGDLGVSGSTGDDDTAALQEVEGTEALKFELEGTASQVTLDLIRFYADDDGNGNCESIRLQAYDDEHNLVEEFVAVAESLSGDASLTFEMESGFSELMITSGAYDDSGEFIYGALSDGTDNSGAVSDDGTGSDFMVESIAFDYTPTDDSDISLIGVADTTTDTLLG